MKIGILGAGMVGANLGRGWAAAGHQVMFSSRTPNSEQMQALAQETGATVATAQKVVNFAEVIAVAIPWAGLPEVVRGISGWDGKVVIDATNRLGGSDSPNAAGIDLQRLIPTTAVVKAFNTIGAEHYTNPMFGEQAATMFYCGDDTDAKATVRQLIDDLGFEAIDAGDLSNAILLEDLTKLWISLARGGMGRNIAFKLLKK